ncbi:unnamed protein product [Danaus chrysippus]|uniref:(African queen) hypothetical protein n=1 Tax=Danaus chrysippus TaxID=151541 RepID=A0A8J2W8R7_9NEOP|nr:unnamed protein product [Danaus chrysippus]
MEIIKKAVEEYASSRNVKLEEVAKKYGIHKSVLYRHCTRDMKQHGGQRALSDETDMFLIENINKCAEWGYPLDTLDLRQLIYMILGSNTAQRVLDIIGRHLDGLMEPLLRIGYKNMVVPYFKNLPANSTHLTQPLDVAFFRPMKRAWRQLLLKWKKTDGRQLPTIPKGCFPKLLKLLIDELQINASKNIIAGFKKTGISPLNATEILARLPGEDLGEDHESAVEDSVLTLLKEMRYGKSVAPEEIEDYAETDVDNSMANPKKTKYDTSISGPSENNETKGKAIEDITKKSETEDKGNNDNNKEWKEVYHNNSEQSKCGNISQKDYDYVNVTAYENYDNNMGEQNYNSIADMENYNSNLQGLECKVSNDMDINSLPILFFDSLCEEVTISTGTTADDNTIKENKVKIISNELVNDGQYNKKYKLPIIKKSKTVLTVKDLIKLPKKKHTNNYYNDSDEILKVLEEDDDDL